MASKIQVCIPTVVPLCGALSIILIVWLQAMESKLLVGGNTIVDHTSEQERKVEAVKHQLAAQRVVLQSHFDQVM